MTTEHGRLADDRCRCQGRDCDRKADCLRFLSPGAPRSPWTERFCTPGREAAGFIAQRGEARP